MSEEKRRFSGSTVLIVSALSAAAAFAAGRSMNSDTSSATTTTSTTAPMATAAMMTSPEPADPLPPGHPAIDPNAAPATAPPAESSLSWKTPAKWQVMPNTSSMRLATYRVGGDAEMAVSQAGGSVDANVERWISQFGPDAKKNAKVTTKKVSGLDVTIVDVTGTFAGEKTDWALLGAIVATPGMPHFFKLTGPAKTVKAARPELDELVASFTTK